MENAHVNPDLGIQRATEESAKAYKELGRRFRPQLIPGILLGGMAVAGFYLYCKSQLDEIERNLHHQQRLETIMPFKFADSPLAKTETEMEKK